jgi:hypothetical protein
MRSPGIPAGGHITQDIVFSHVKYDLWDRDIRISKGLGLRHEHQHIPEAVGAYACGRNNWGDYLGWRGSSFRITVGLQATEGVRVGTKISNGRFAATQDRASCGSVQD